MCFNYRYRSRKMSRLRCRHRHALFVFIYIIFSRKSYIKLDLNVSCCLILSKTAFLSHLTVVFVAGSDRIISGNLEMLTRVTESMTKNFFHWIIKGYIYTYRHEKLGNFMINVNLFSVF